MWAALLELVELMCFAPWFWNMQGYFKVLGKGVLPEVPIVVKAKYFSKEVRSTWVCVCLVANDWLSHTVCLFVEQAEKKIKAAGGACLLTA